MDFSSDSVFVIICRHLGSFIFPLNITASNQLEAINKFNTANALINNQVVPTFCFETRQASSLNTPPALNLTSWLGSAPFTDFDAYLRNWLWSESYSKLDKHVHVSLQLERLRAGEVIRNKLRRGSTLVVEIKTEEGLCVEVETTRQALYEPTPAQVFSESLGHAFDFASEIDDMITSSLVRERDAIANRRERLRTKKV